MIIKKGRKLYAQKFYGDVMYFFKIFMKKDPELFFEDISSVFMPYINGVNIRRGSKYYEVPIMIYPHKRLRSGGRRLLKAILRYYYYVKPIYVANEYMRYVKYKTNKILVYHRAEMKKAIEYRANVKYLRKRRSRQVRKLRKNKQSKIGFSYL